MTPDRWLSLIGLSGTVLFGALSVYFYVRPRHSRRLDVLWASSIVQTRRHPRVKIYFDDREVETISRVRIMFRNSGTGDIRRNDLAGKSNVEIHTKESEVLSVACIGGPVEETGATIATTSQDKAVFSFEYLNPTQAVVAELILAGSTRPNVTANIIGGALHVRRWTDESAHLIANLFVELLVFVGAITVSSSFEMYRELFLKQRVMFIVTILIVTMVLIFVSRYLRKKRQNTYGLLTDV